MNYLNRINTNRDLYKLFKENGFTNDVYKDNANKVIALFKELGGSSELTEFITEKVRKYCNTVHQKRQSVYHIEKDFLNKFADWLDLSLTWKTDIRRQYCLVPTCSSSTSATTLENSSNLKKKFCELSDRQKRRRTEDLRAYPPEYLQYAASKNVSGIPEDAQYIYDFICKYPEHVKKLRTFCEELLLENSKVDNEDALNMYVTCKLTKHQYKSIRAIINVKAENLLPSYHIIQKSKEECYPPSESLVVTESEVKYRLQPLIDTTVSRLLKSLNYDTDNETKLVCICKWGCDGSSGQARYKHTFLDSSGDDSSVFCCSFVPIKLYNEETNETIWQNPVPSSTRYCRPILFKFAKETPELVKTCVEQIDEEIRNITLFTKKQISVRYEMILTMIDTKICNDLAENRSSMRCYLCNANPKLMNNLNAVDNLEVNENYYSFGLSSLHGWIRCFECLLHIAYNLPFACWTVKGENKILRDERKKKIQLEFREKTGLLIDVVKQGSGKTNDGNTARSFFRNYKLTAEITGLNVDLLKRFYVILQVIASGYKVNIENFELYARETAQMYVNLYGWYYMPVTVHKILIHGSEIIRHAMVPIGLLSEDAQESNHKMFRYYRLHNTRKISRALANKDLMNALILSSDPLLTSRAKFIKKEEVFLKDCESLFDDEIVRKYVDEIPES